MQKQHWDPLHEWVKDDLGIDLRVAEGFLPARQTEETKDNLRRIISDMDPWDLAGGAQVLLRSNQHSSVQSTPPNPSSSLLRCVAVASQRTRPLMRAMSRSVVRSNNGERSRIVSHSFARR